MKPVVNKLMHQSARQRTELPWFELGDAYRSTMDPLMEMAWYRPNPAASMLLDQMLLFAVERYCPLELLAPAPMALNPDKLLVGTSFPLVGWLR